MNNIDISISDSEATYDDSVLVRHDGMYLEVSHLAFEADHERRWEAALQEDPNTRWDDRIPLDEEAERLLKKLLAA